MKVEYTPESQLEKNIIDMILNEPESVERPIEERVAFLERQAASSVLASMMVQKTLKDFANQFEDDEESEDAMQKIFDDIENIKRTINLLHQTTLELEESNVRIRNLEHDLKALKQSCKVTDECLNKQASLIHKLWYEAYGEDIRPDEEKEKEPWD